MSTTTVVKKKVIVDNAELAKTFAPPETRTVKVFPLDKLEADMRAELERQHERERKHLAERIGALGKARQAMMLLDAIPSKSHQPAGFQPAVIIYPHPANA